METLFIFAAFAGLVGLGVGIFLYQDYRQAKRMRTGGHRT